jgi:hypothetical protein
MWRTTETCLVAEGQIRQFDSHQQSSGASDTLKVGAVPMSSNSGSMRATGPTAEPPDPMSFVDDGEDREARSGRTYPPHPLFPREDGEPETRDIRFVTFRRRRSDGKVDNCPDDIPADEVRSWAAVIGPWGGGEYKVIGKDDNHRIVAWYPSEKGAWLLFDQPSKPFTLRDERLYGGSIHQPSPAPRAYRGARPGPLGHGSVGGRPAQPSRRDQQGDSLRCAWGS